MFKFIHLREKVTEQQGFTLLEVLFAMVIATIGLLGLALMQGYAIEGNGAGSRFTQATFLAQDMLENIKDGNISNRFGQVNMTNEPVDTLLDSGPVTSVDENGNPGGPFNRSWEIRSNTEWSRLVVVTVNWNDNTGRNRQLRLTTVSRGDGN